MSSQGLKFDGTKPDMSLIPAAALLEEAGVWTFGKQKYAAFNWHKGITFNRILAAIDRHSALLKAGIDMDYETRRHHAASIRCGCAMLIQFTLEERTDLDDRMELSDEVKFKIESLAKGELITDIIADLTKAG
ncbi:MAG: dATP/dGTP diphosphohydrolase domain-containing protein [Candidatus Paceibacterota bacterium]